MSETSGDRIAASLRTIRRCWADMLPEAPTVGSGERVRTSKEPPLPIPVGVLSLRRELCEVLVSWVRLVVDEALDVNGQAMDVHLDGKDAPQMAGWLLRWADWLGGHEAGEVAVQEIGTYAQRCDDVVSQRRVRRFKVGPCVDHVTTDLGERAPCPGTLHATLSSDQDLLPATLRCDFDPQHAYSASDWRRLGERIHSAITVEEAHAALVRRIVST